MITIPDHAETDVTKLSPIIQVMFNHAKKHYDNKHVMGKIAAAYVIETVRTNERQWFLYSKGRTVEQCIAKGIPAANAREYVNYCTNHGYNKIVSKTLNSIHIKKRAIDVVPYVDAKVPGKKELQWFSSKQSVYVAELILSMNRYGFEDGDSWKSFKDSPHFQVDSNISTVVTKKNTTKNLTIAIQNALNALITNNVLSKYGIKNVLVVDGSWGAKTDAAITAFRTSQKYKNVAPSIGYKALNRLFDLYDKYSK